MKRHALFVAALTSSAVALAAAQNQPAKQPEPKPPATQPATQPPKQPEKQPETKQPKAGPVSISFDADKPGGPPRDWKVEGTRQEGPIASWAVTPDENAPTSPNVLAMTRANHESQETLNLCWTDSVLVQDGSISAMLRADAAGKGQCGIIWRAANKDNYYHFAMSHDGNMRLFAVKDGKARDLKSVEAKLEPGRWYTVKINQAGEQIECWLDGKKALDLKDSTHMKAGGFGFCTKGDTRSAFDSLIVVPAPEKTAPAPKEAPKSDMP